MAGTTGPKRTVAPGPQPWSCDRPRGTGRVAAPTPFPATTSQVRAAGGAPTPERATASCSRSATEAAARSPSAGDEVTARADGRPVVAAGTASHVIDGEGRRGRRDRPSRRRGRRLRGAGLRPHAQRTTSLRRVVQPSRRGPGPGRGPVGSRRHRVRGCRCGLDRDERGGHRVVRHHVWGLPAGARAGAGPHQDRHQFGVPIASSQPVKQPGRGCVRLHPSGAALCKYTPPSPPPRGRRAAGTAASMPGGCRRLASAWSAPRDPAFRRPRYTWRTTFSSTCSGRRWPEPLLGSPHSPCLRVARDTIAAQTAKEVPS